jgi:hypothetical protein
VIVDIDGGDRPQTGIFGEASERGNAAGIAEDEIVLQLDRDIVRAEPLDILTEEMTGVTPAASVDQTRERAPPTAGEQDQSSSVFREQRGIEAGLPLLVFFPNRAGWGEGGEATRRR